MASVYSLVNQEAIYHTTLADRYPVKLIYMKLHAPERCHNQHGLLHCNL